MCVVLVAGGRGWGSGCCGCGLFAPCPTDGRCFSGVVVGVEFFGEGFDGGGVVDDVVFGGVG